MKLRVKYQDRLYLVDIPNDIPQEQIIQYLKDNKDAILNQLKAQQVSFIGKPIKMADVIQEQRRLSDLTRGMVKEAKEKGFIDKAMEFLTKPPKEQIEQTGLALSEELDKVMQKAGLTEDQIKEVKGEIGKTAKDIFSYGVNTLEKIVNTILRSTGIAPIMGAVEKPLEEYNIARAEQKPFTKEDLIEAILKGLAENMPTIVEYIPALRDRLKNAIPTSFEGEAGSLAPILKESVKAVLPENLKDKKAIENISYLTGMALDFYLFPKLIPKAVRTTKLGEAVSEEAKKISELSLPEQVKAIREGQELLKTGTKTPEALAKTLGDITAGQNLSLNLAEGTKTISDIFPEVSQAIGKTLLNLQQKLSKSELTPFERAQAEHLAYLVDKALKDKEITKNIMKDYLKELTENIAKEFPAGLSDEEKLRFIYYLEHPDVAIPEDYPLKGLINKYKDAMEKIYEAEGRLGTIGKVEGYYPHQKPSDIELGARAGYHFAEERKIKKPIEELVKEGKNPFSIEPLPVLEQRIITSPAITQKGLTKFLGGELGKPVTAEEVLRRYETQAIKDVYYVEPKVSQKPLKELNVAQKIKELKDKIEKTEEFKAIVKEEKAKIREILQNRLNLIKQKRDWYQQELEKLKNGGYTAKELVEKKKYLKNIYEKELKNIENKYNFKLRNYTQEIKMKINKTKELYQQIIKNPDNEELQREYLKLITSLENVELPNTLIKRKADEIKLVKNAVQEELKKYKELTKQDISGKVEELKNELQTFIKDIKSKTKDEIKAIQGQYNIKKGELKDIKAREAFLKEFENIKIVELTDEQNKLIKSALEIIKNWNTLSQPPEFIKVLLPAWKNMALFTQPGTWLRNAIANKLLRFYNAIPPLTKFDALVIKKIIPKIKLVSGNAVLELTDDIKNLKILLNGKEYQLGDVLNEAVRQGILDNIMTSTGKTMLSEKGGIAKLWFNFNKTMWSKIESMDRLSTFLYYLDKGYSFDKAGRLTLRALYDYSKMPRFIKALQEIGVPFISWYYRNVIQGIPRMLAQESGRVASIQKAKENIERLVGKPIYKTEYQQEAGSYAIYNPQYGISVMWDFINYDPLVQINLLQVKPELSETLKSTGLNILQLNNPFINLFAELMANESFYYGTEIQKAKGERVNFLGLDMPPILAYSMRALVPILGYIDRLNPFDIFGSAYYQKPSIFSPISEALGGSPIQREKVENDMWIRVLRTATGINWKTADVHLGLRSLIYKEAKERDDSYTKFSQELAGKTHIRTGKEETTFDINWKNALVHLNNAIQSTARKYVLEEIRALSYMIGGGDPDQIGALYFGKGEYLTPEKRIVKLSEKEAIFPTLYDLMYLSRTGLELLTKEDLKQNIINDIGQKKYEELMNLYKNIYMESYSILKSAVDNLRNLPDDIPLKKVKIQSENKELPITKYIADWQIKLKQQEIIPKLQSYKTTISRLRIKPTGIIEEGK